MKKAKIGTAAVYVICALLTIAAFFAKDFVLYDFEMEPSNYRYTESDAERDFHAETSFWFSCGPDRELQYGFADNVSPDSIRLYARTENEFIPITAQDMNPIREDFIGYFAAALPAQFIDVDGDGTAETVYDFARADLGPHTYELEPREFNSSDFPFEVAFAERKVIQVFYHNELLTDRSVTVVSADGTAQTYYTDNNGWIDGLPIDVLRSGFTVSYSPDGQNVYRMYYAIEDYDYFSLHFFKAYLPLLVVLLLTAIGIVIVYVIRERYARRDPAYAI